MAKKMLLIIIGTILVIIFFTYKKGETRSPQSKIETDSNTIEFSGRIWRIVKSYGLELPGPNYWSDSKESVWKDDQGRLHLKIRKDENGIWYSAGIYTDEFVKYGIYRFYVISRLDNIDKNVVFGLFLRKDDEHEIDIEFSKWGFDNPGCNAQYTIHPSGVTDICVPTQNYEPFFLQLSGDYTTHYIDWHQSWIKFKSIHGHYSEPPDSNYLIHQWLYQGNDIPFENENLRAYVNLWLVNGNHPSDEKEIEVIIEKIEFPLIWSSTKRLTWNSGYSYDPAIATDPSGNIHVVWYDSTSGNTEIYYKRSTDGGSTWQLTKRLTWNSGESRYPAIATDSGGNIQRGALMAATLGSQPKD